MSSDITPSARQGRHLRDASLDSAASSTPTRPPRPSRASTYTPNSEERASHLNLARRSLLAGPGESVAAEVKDDADRTPRKGHAHGLPTPPLSEATSSASGSVGRTRKVSTEAASSAHLMIPARESRSARSASATSSRTGSDTVGARSPVEQHSSFVSSRYASDSPANPSGSSAGTVSRRRGTVLKTAIADPPERERTAAASPAAGRTVPRAQLSLGMRSIFADDGRRGPLSLARMGDDHVGSNETPDRAERKKRSAMHEQDVTQIRSESRLGQTDAIDEDETSPRKLPLQHKYSLRKSTTLSRGRYNDDGRGDDHYTSPLSGNSTSLRSPPPTFRSISRASGGRTQQDDLAPDTRPATSIGSRSGDYSVARRSLGTQMNYDEMASASASARRRSLRAVEASHGDDASLAEASTGRKSSSGRSPLPLEFRLPDKEARRAWREAQAREPSDSVTSDGSEGAGAIDDGDDHARFATSRKLSISESVERVSPGQGPASISTDATSSTRLAQRRKRYVSDTQSDELPPMDYEGRLGSQGSRISVDATSANRYLTRGPLQGTPQSARHSSRAVSEMGSPSEEARIRKISTSSSRSHKSSGGASELHRTASRASMRKLHGRDVFDDEVLPALPGSRSESPAHRSDVASTTSDRLRSLRLRVGDLKDLKKPGSNARPGWRTELDELRNRIDELTVASSKAPASDSRSPSVHSHRTHSALGLHRTPLDGSRIRRAPMTEPRNLYHDRSSTLSGLGSGDGSERSAETEGQRHNRTYNRATIGGSRASLASSSGRAPTTPDPYSSLRLAAGSRASAIHSATLPATARFPSGGYNLSAQRVRSEGSTSDGANPVHDRNMRNAFDMFERHFCAAPSTSTPSVDGAGPDSLEMVASFGEVVATASELNAGLRFLIQVTLEGQVDAEISERNGAAVSEQTLECFARLDRDLTDLLKRSDEQVRNLTDGLMAVTRAERERDRQRKAAVGSGEHQGFGTRSASRMSALASPVEEIRRSIEARSSSMLIREPASPAGTVVDHGSVERKADRFRSADRYATSSQRTPASPYSPLQAKTNAATFGGTLTASQMRNLAAATTSATGSHSRSASEYSPQSRLRREKSTLMDTVKMPALSPRRPKLSFPSVSNATASFNPATLSDAPSTTESPILADGIAFPRAPQDEHAVLLPTRARQFDSEPTELVNDAAPWTVSARAAAVPPVSSRHSRRNTVAGTTGAEEADPSGLGIVEATSPRSVDVGSESKRSSRIDRPPRPPRHDLMRRDTTEEEGGEDQPHRSTASIRSTESVAGGGSGGDASGMARLGSISRSIGRSAARRISKTFNSGPGHESAEAINVEEAHA